MTTLGFKVLIGICALQMGCSGNADSSTTGSGGQSSAIGGSSSGTLAGTSNVLGGTSGIGGVTSAPTGGAVASGGTTSTFASVTNTRASCGASLCASGEKCCDPSCGMCSVNQLCPAAVCPAGGTGAIGGNAGTGGGSLSQHTGGASAVGGASTTGGVSANGGNSASTGVTTGGTKATGGNSGTTGASSGGASSISGGSNGTGGLATLGGATATGGASQSGSGACSEITSAADCDARTGCHSVYQDPGTCDCAAIGCCARFSRCVDGDKAHCAAQAVACPMAQPHCEEPAYVISYSGNCYEGCVKPTDCDAPGVCGSNCTISTTLTSPVCAAASKLVLSCAPPYPTDLAEIMIRNGCTEAGLSTAAYCCPPLIQTQCS